MAGLGDWISTEERLPGFGEVVLVRYVMCNSVGMNPTAYVALGRLLARGWCDREAGWRISSTLSSDEFCQGGITSKLSHDFVTHWYPFPPVEPVPECEVKRQNKRIEDYMERTRIL